MSRLTLRIDPKVCKVVVVVLFFTLQRMILSNYDNTLIGYLDEIFAVVVVLDIILNLISGYAFFDKLEINGLFAMTLLLVIGLIGNLFSGVLNNAFAITVDIISIYKVFLAFYWIRMQNLTGSQWKAVIRGLVKCMRLLVLVMLVAYVVGYVFNISYLFADVRYGIKSYSFFFGGVSGNFSKIFYFIVPLFTAQFYYEKSRKNVIYLALSLLIWISTLRSRAISFAACYVIFVFYYFVLRSKQKNKISIATVLPIGIIALLLGWEQLIFYFTTDTQARSLLLRYAIVTAREYFPIGAGFGTYGSDVARTYYSALYTQYGFSSIYGMGLNGTTQYMNDNYWPMILGQFGFIGCIIVVYILYVLYKFALDRVKDNKYFYCASLVAAGFLIVSSIASKSYSEFSSISVLMLQAIFVQAEIKRKEENDDICIEIERGN